MSLPKVIVITLNWNGERWLKDCLDSVLALTYPNFGIVVVDNGSTDGSVGLITSHYPSVGLIRNPENLGYARGFNRGLEQAASLDADYFLIMNNDTVIDPHALTALVQCAQSAPAAGFVTGKVYYHDHPTVLQTVGKKQNAATCQTSAIGTGENDHGQYDEAKERDFVDDIFVLVDRRLYKDVGGYDPQFYLQAEEYDWQLRAKKQGWRCYYTPGAKIYHRVSMSMGGAGSPVGRYFDTRSTMVAIYRHAALRQFLRYYVLTFFNTTLGLAKAVLQLDPAKIKPRLAMWLGFWSATFWLAHRKAPTKPPAIVLALNQ